MQVKAGFSFQSPTLPATTEVVHLKPHGVIMLIPGMAGLRVSDLQ